MNFFDSDRLSEIWQTIARNKKRSIMTALGVFWGIFMLTLMLGAGTGFGRLFRAQLGDMSTNTIFIQHRQTSLSYKGMPRNRWWQLNNDDVEVIKQMEQVRYASGVFWGNDLKCSYNQSKGNYPMMGFSADYQKINPQKIIYGRFINEIDIIQKRKVCVIGQQVWKDLFPDGENPLGKIINANDSYFTVVGVAVHQSEMTFFGDINRSIITPISLAQQISGSGRTIHILAVTGHDNVPNKELVKACKAVLFSRHIIAPDDKKAAWVNSTAEQIDMIKNLFRGITILIWIVGLGTLIAGIVGVSNIMLVLVKERTQEIGVRRAIGAPPWNIISQILSESFVLTFIAGVLGLTSAVGLLSIVDYIYYQQIVVANDGVNISWQISLATGIIATAILMFGSLLAGIIPALRALSIKAVDAIREE
ncbi:MAG: ABC transporter permease [Rikenellaceae bacterium]